MKYYLVIFLLLMPAALFAQNPFGMSPESMQNMMQKAQQVQACVAKIDQGKLKELQAKSERMSQEVKNLCLAGKRDEAQKTAIGFGKEVASDTTMQQMRECGEIAKDALPMFGDSIKTYDEKEYADKHVCDE